MLENIKYLANIIIEKMRQHASAPMDTAAEGKILVARLQYTMNANGMNQRIPEGSVLGGTIAWNFPMPIYSYMRNNQISVQDI